MAFGLALGVSACAGTVARAPAASAPRASATAPSLGADVSAHWERRADRAELQAAIDALSERARADGPAGAAAATQLANAYCLMGESMLAHGWADAASADQQLVLGAQAAERAHSIAPSGASGYWLAANLQAHAELSGFAELATSEARIRALLVEAAQLAPQIDGGGPARRLAALYAHPATPSMRDLSQARAQLDRALQLDRDDLRNALAYVEHFALPAQDVQLARTQLQRIARAAASSAEDRIAQARAAKLAARLDEVLE